MEKPKKGVQMKEFDMVGMRTIGNVELLQKPHARIGVFASRQLDSVGSIIKEQWSVAKGRQRKCIVGTFHSRSECEILYLVLKYGGSAVWFMGCKLPDTLPDFCKKAVKSGRLLMVSCFNREPSCSGRWKAAVCSDPFTPAPSPAASGWNAFEGN